MRQLIVCNLISLDGFFAGPGNDVMALPFDTTFSEYNAERLRAADTLLLGARTFAGFRDYWPPIKDDPRQPPLEREISRLTTVVEKAVVSDSLTPDDLGAWAATTRIVGRANARAAIDELKRGPGREILVFGSHMLWNDLLRADLVDELHLMIGSALLGDGVPVFAGERTDLRLLDTRRLADSQLILARYAPGAA